MYLINNNNSSQKAFTLVELLVVITIIAILSTIGLVAYGTFLKNARDARRQADLKFIQSALEEYHADQHYYPSGTTLGSSITNNTTPLKTYLTTVPKDPKDQSAYSYVASSCDNNSANCTSYCLSANIEGTVPLDLACTPSSGFNYAVTRP